MPWNESYALHIFVPTMDPFADNWVEQVLGAVIKPIVDKYQQHISWLWITRYSNIYNADEPPRGYVLPEQFRTNGRYRFVVFRLHSDEDVRDELHQEAILLAEGEQCYPEPNGWLPYDPIEDLGSDRFARADATNEVRSERARLIAFFVDATIRLMLHSLSSDDSGKWSLEPNALNEQNPKGSLFESVHHLFCNATGVPTTVLVGGEWTSLQIGTYWMGHIVLAGNEGQEIRVEVPVSY